MGTGGTGDVLAGIITALVCQKLLPYDAARLGWHVHGLAGEACIAGGIDHLPQDRRVAYELLAT